MATLKIDISSRASGVENTKTILQNIFKIMPSVLDTYGKLARAAAFGIAPFSSRQKKRSQKESYDKRSGTRLREGIFIRKHGDLSFSLGVRGEGSSGVKVIMQEYGYPYDTRELITPDEDGDESTTEMPRLVGFKPYPPNPKNAKNYNNFPNSKIKGIGYLRAGLVAASKYFLYKSFHPDSILNNVSTEYPMVNRREVLNYQAEVTYNLTVGIQRFITDYAKGKITSLSSDGTTYNKKGIDNRVGIPLTSQNIDAVNSSLISFQPISKYTSKFGSIELDFNELEIETERYGRFSPTMLRNESFTGRQLYPGRDFLI